MATQPSALLKELADATRLREGPCGVRRVLFEILRAAPDPIPTGVLAAQVGLPIPVLAALRREMESRSLLVRNAGASASGRGVALLEALFGTNDIRALPPLDAPVDKEIEPTLRSWANRRPEIDGKLDQSRATVETAWRRTLFLLHAGAALGQRIAFLGDDDLSALTLLLTIRSFLKEPVAEKVSCTVLEIDERYIQFMEEIAALEGFQMEIRRHDLRQPLTEDCSGRFDTFVTDPPYTFEGAVCFLTRGLECFPRDFGGMGLFSFGAKGTRDVAEVQNWITGQGVAIRNMRQGFNQYEGASILASSSDLYLLDVPPGSALEEAPRVFEGPLYTADHRALQRRYKCRGCGATVPVGPDERFETIADLRATGCPRCGEERFKLFG